MTRSKRAILLAVVVGILMSPLLHVSSFAALPKAAVTSTISPSFAEAVRMAHFAEPLVLTSVTSAVEEQALSRALDKYNQRSTPDDVSALLEFLAAHPHSPWAPALFTNIGLSDLHYGYFSRSLEAFRRAWKDGKDATDPRVRAITDRAVGELARLYASFGQFDKLAALFDEIGKRPITGSATEAVQEAREELVLVTKDPRHLFNCGPVGLKLWISAVSPQDKNADFLESYRVGPTGTNLNELVRLAAKAKLSAKVIRRAPGQQIPVPALVHWKVGHFSALLGEANGRYRIEDPVFPGVDIWVTHAALDAEASGYFLVSAKMPLSKGWKIANAADAGRVWGKGPTYGTRPGDAGDPTARKKNGKNPCPMCEYDIKEATVGLTLFDSPVGYTPPIGPAALVQITYNQREDSQPANFNFFNVSPKWTLNWLTYVTDDPTNPGASVTRYLSGGGAYYYTGYNSGTGQFTAQDDDGSILVFASQSTPTYRRQLSDGSVEIYSQSDGSTSYPRKVFLSQVIDPQGNTLTLTYDTQMRLTSLTDAVGRQTTFTYNQSYLITKITDPFGRSAVLSYDTSGRLASITDIIGLTSRFTYDANSLVNSMTTPYGTTTFSYTAPGAAGPPRFVQVTDPLGLHEREEWLEPAPIPDSDPASSIPQGMPLPPTNHYLTYRDSFYWDKDAYVVAGCTPTGGCDYTKARDTHFLHVSNAGMSLKSTTVESIKYPLEGRIWYSYPGQTSSIYTGTYSQPTATGRVLDDGSTQLSKASYDTSGYFKLLQVTDPVGRITTYSYSNQIDLSTVSQTIAGGAQTTVAQFVYNTQHRPTTATDAAGQTTTYTYNGAGQITSATNPLNQTTTLHYDTSANLTSVTNANNATAATYTYDAFDRIATFTDSEGWAVSYTYDAADRLTKVTYPDGTTEAYTYNKLDLASFRDRIGRVWAYTYDSDRRLTAVTDPAGKQTLYAYNGEGQITGQTDPNSHVTQWAYDVEGRLITKTYADNSTLAYAYEATTSRLKTRTDALGQVKQFGYMGDDSIATIVYQSAVNPTPNVSFTYDSYFPRVASMTDGSGTTQYTYNPVGTLGALKLAQEITPLTKLVYAYDALGRINSRTVGAAGSEAFQYDQIGRLSVHSSDLGSFAFNYLGQTGQPVSRQLASSTLQTSWSYLPNSGDRRLAGISNIGLSSANFTNFQYTTNPIDQITGITQTSDTATSYPASTLNQSASYNNLNQLTALSSQALTYDADGNLTSDGMRQYSWDAENRLIEITYPGQSGKSTTFTYDGVGRRISIASATTGGTTTNNYVWCGKKLCQAWTGGSAQRSYYTEGELAAGSANYYGIDQIGSVRRVFNSSATPNYDFDPYGNALQTTAPVTDFDYAGLVYNSDSGLYLATNRPYDPVSGRFLSRDPLGEAGDSYGNLYAYVEGNPIYLADPAGLFCFPSLPDLLKPFLAQPIHDINDFLNGLRNHPEQTPQAIQDLLGPFPGLANDVAGLRAIARALDEGIPVAVDFSITWVSNKPNYRADITPDQFGQGLEGAGYSRSTSQDGQAQNYENGISKYSIRNSDQNGSTADAYPNGASRPTVKIRLGQ